MPAISPSTHRVAMLSLALACAGLLTVAAPAAHAQDGALRIADMTMAQVLPAADVQAVEQLECDIERGVRPPSINFRVDNDLLGGQNEGYTGGVLITLVSPNVRDYTDDPCLPSVARFVNSGLTWLQPGSAEHRNMTFTIGQGIFTPSDATRTTLDPNDRPYAGLVVAGIGYHARNGDALESNVLRFGWVGPAALGRQVQHAVHKLIDSEQFQGWSNQLRNEPVFALQKEWARRWPADDDRDLTGRRWDVLTHWGGSIGNLQTGAIVGGQLRFGSGIPDDFGSLPLWASGENSAPPRRAFRDGRFSGHFFVGADVRMVLYDVTLDGNTFRDSHSVDKKTLVPELSYGFVVQKGAWKFALARYHRGHEFDGQKRRPVFGSFTIARSL